MKRQKVILSWSTGKDSALCLCRLMEDPRWELVGLWTTYNEAKARTAIHGVRLQMLDLQAERLGLPCIQTPLPDPCTNAEYERRVGHALRQIRRKGIRHIAFGDIFLEDVRAYRERLLQAYQMEGVYMLWGQDTRALSREVLDRGIHAVVTCVDTAALHERFVGRDYDERFLSELPDGVDPCGERGEFHTLVVGHPHFHSEIKYRRGRFHRSGRFVYRDFIPQ